MLLGQILQSHALHAYFWSLSDFFGIKSDLDLIKKYPGLTREVLKIRDWSNQLIKVIGGRAIHPISPRIGGFKKLPEKKELKALLLAQPQVFESALKIADFFKKLHYPDFKRKTEFISLHHPQEYAFYQGCIKVEEKICLEEQFLKDIREIQLPYQLVKRTVYKGKTFRVGALARIHLNGDKLNPEAKKILNSAKFENHNPFFIVFAQTVEILHGLEEAKKILENLLREGLKKEKLPDYQKLKLFSGVGAIEAPRGTLYHAYRVDPRGLIRKVNIITPTAQNFAALEEDLKEYLTSQDSITEKKRKIKILVRAYDPCVPCATH
jgi:coenzyme F420-reducing hydrogenase alpha subunit